MAKSVVTKSQLVETFKKFMPLFSTKVHLILFYGSLLGYVRNNDFLENDDDIDFLLYRDERQIMLNILDPLAKSQILRVTINNANILQLCFADSDVPIDIYFFDRIWNNQILIRWDGNITFDRADIFPLQEIILYQQNVFIPHNNNRLLQLIYGDNWQIPISKKDYTWSNITKTNFLNEKQAKKAIKQGVLSDPIKY